MFKQASNRYQRSKGFKVKHAFQIALLAAVSIWLLYQVKHSHDKRHAYDEKHTAIQVEGNVDSAGGWNGKEFGRKGKLEVFGDDSTSISVNSERNEGNAEEEDEIKDLHTSSVENDHQDQGVGDDEIDGREEEKTEEEGSQQENAKIREKVENDDGGKVLEAEEEEQNGDVGSKFVQIIKQETETEGTEETRETKGDHNENEEETPEIKDEKHDEEKHGNAEKQSENEPHEGEEDQNAEKQSENEPHKGEEDKNAEKHRENEHQEKEEVKIAEKKSKNKHNDHAEDKNAETKGENEHRDEEGHKIAEKHSENEQEIAPPRDLSGENVEKNLTESRLVPNIVLKENETVAASPSPKGDIHVEKSADVVKIEESGAVNNETIAVDDNKDAALADSNAKEEAEKLKEKNQEANMTSTISYSDSNAETEHERLEENSKVINASVAEDHEMEQRLTAKYETETETRKQLDELASSESKIETENTSQTKSRDIKPDSSMDQGTAEDEAGLSNEKRSDGTEGFQNSGRSEQNLVIDEETSSRTDDSSEGGLILPSSESNSTTESEHPDGGDATLQDMPGENEAGDRTDLGTLPESETEGQTSEEISAQ